MSLDSAMGLTAQGEGVGRFNAKKLNSYLYVGEHSHNVHAGFIVGRAILGLLGLERWIGSSVTRLC